MNPLHRILDANANRSREALRVMEDLARFALNDAALSASLKSLRHDLTQALGSLDVAASGAAHPSPAPALISLIAARDTGADVGTAISTPGEQSRPDLATLARANGSRLSEALRSLEESTKALGISGSPFEALRYRAYVVEQSLILALARPAVPMPCLCVLVTRSLCRLPWTEVVQAALEGGASMIQLREKELSDRDLLHAARTLVQICRRHRSPSGHADGKSDPLPALAIINDRADIAVLADADGVHIGPDDLPPADARRIIGPQRLLGISTDSVARAHEAIGAGADLCGVGPMFTTSTKDKPVTLGPTYLEQYLADPVASPVPHLAIGGITPSNLPELTSRGCTGIAVSSVVCGAPDPERVCRELMQTLRAAAPSSTPTIQEKR